MVRGHEIELPVSRIMSQRVSIEYWVEGERGMGGEGFTVSRVAPPPSDFLTFK